MNANESGRDLAGMRRTYVARGLHESDLAPDPVTQFTHWFDEAVEAGLREPNAMVLATSTPEGVPSSRMVLLKSYDDSGFTFFSNASSRKGRELAANSRAALLFPWHDIERQVRVEGAATLLDQESVVSYYQSRPRGSQLGAWASDQSEIISGREVLEQRMRSVEARWADGAPIATPDTWVGYRVSVESVEFWQGRESRLHDRLRYRRRALGDTDLGDTDLGDSDLGDSEWVIERLAP